MLGNDAGVCRFQELQKEIMTDVERLAMEEEVLKVSSALHLQPSTPSTPSTPAHAFNLGDVPV